MYYFHYQIGSKRDLKNNLKISKNTKKNLSPKKKNYLAVRATDIHTTS